MKKLFFFSIFALIALTACEHQKPVPKPSEIELSFEYRQTEKKNGKYYIDYRNTSKPDMIDQGDLWYRFHEATGGADAIGDGFHILPDTGTYEFTVQYKPGVGDEPNAVYASRKFKIHIDTIIPTVWMQAIPTTETQIP